MTNDLFKELLNISGGQFEFYTDKHEGMIGLSPSQIMIWVDDLGFGKITDDVEPKNIGYYNSIDDLLKTFKVDNELFADNVLPQITSLIRLLS